MIRKVLPALAALLLLPLSLVAQQTFATSSPEAATTAYMDAMKEGQIDRMAGMMHPEALASFRSMLQPAIEAADKEASNELLEMFAGVGSLTELAKLSDAKFFALFFAGAIALQPEVLEALRGAESEILGHVDEGDDVAHVVYRMSLSVGEVSVSKTEVVSLQKTQSGWGLLLTGEMEGMAQGIRQSLEMSRQ